MSRIVLFIVGIIFLLSACTQRMTCPAFQSAYIYDKEALRKKFSYFQEDSTPKVFTASKTKYLIAVPESYRKKVRSLQTVEMKPVYPVIPDSLRIEQDQDLILAERDIIDSAAIQQGLDRSDSAYAITRAKEKFNVDQDNYMWYFRDVLVLPDVRAALEQKSGEKLGVAAGGPNATKEKKGFFKNLFKKKNKNDSISVDGPEAPTDYTDGKANTKRVKKPKNKKVNTKAEDKKPVPVKKEEEDDGFGGA